MRTPLLFLFLCSFLLSKLHAQSILTIGSTQVEIDTVLTGLDVPWEILYGPDNRIWMTERKGLVSRVDPVLKTKTPVLDITASTYFYGEAGLLGMALHPDFPGTNEVFIAHTYSTAAGTRFEKLVKYDWNGSALVNPGILVDSIIANALHNGSRLMFLPDKTLLMTTGENGYGPYAQDLSSLNGKVLRLNTDGSVPADNPFPGSYVYTYGHRNPQGLVKGPDGQVYLSEHGPEMCDEFQLLIKGRNYGWPDVKGFCNLAQEVLFCGAHQVKEPIVEWTPTIAPSDLVYYSNPAFPEFHNCFLMVTLKEKKIVAIQLDPSGTTYVTQASYLANMFGRLRDICVGPDKEIYLATNGANSWNTDPDTHSLLVMRPVATPVGLTRQENDPTVRVFPTIVTGQITVRTGKPATSAFIVEVSDLCGKSCRKETFPGGDHYADLSGLENGMYFITVTENSKMLHQSKIILNR